MLIRVTIDLGESLGCSQSIKLVKDLTHQFNALAGNSSKDKDPIVGFCPSLQEGSSKAAS